MSKFIINPKTFNKYNINSIDGKKLISKYIKQLGGYHELGDYEYNYSRCNRYHKMPEECMSEGCIYENEICYNNPEEIHEYHKPNKHDY